MAKMRTVDAAVHVMVKEGVRACFGVPGAAINPLYAAMKKSGALQHVLAARAGGEEDGVDGVAVVMDALGVAPHP